MARILVVGASGLVGAAAVRVLAAEGHTVRALQHRRAPEGAHETVAGDLYDRATLARAVAGTDAIVHAGGAMTGSAAELRAVHVEGTQALAAAAAAANVARFVMIGTTAVHPPGRLVRIDEDHPVGPADPYASAKLEAEECVRARFGSRATVLRAVTVYRTGPCPFVRAATAAVQGAIPDVEGVDPPIDLVHADDLAAATLRALACRSGGVYHVTGPAAPFRALVTVVARALGTSVAWAKPGSRAFPAGLLELASVERTVTAERAHRVLGFAPRRAWEPELTRAIRGDAAGPRP